MKVVFLEDVAGTARIGDIKDVKPGFARNYLLPRRLAMAASPSIVKSVERRAVRETRLEEARDTDALAVAKRLEARPLSFTARAGASGKLFGSVGAADIAPRVSEQLGSEFDRHNVLLAEPIKELGDYQVAVKLTRNVNATLSVTVVGEDGTTAADIKARSEGGRRTEREETSDDDDLSAGEDLSAEAEELAEEDFE